MIIEAKEIHHLIRQIPTSLGRRATIKYKPSSTRAFHEYLTRGSELRNKEKHHQLQAYLKGHVWALYGDSKLIFYLILCILFCWF